MSFATKIQTCWDKPFSDAPFTFRMTSPISICPLSAAGCPGKSFFTLTIVEPSCSGVRLSSWQKLNPRPELFFNSFTSNVFSAKETLTYYFLQHPAHEKKVAGALTPDMTMQILPIMGFSHFTKHKHYLKDPSKLKTTKS